MNTLILETSSSASCIVLAAHDTIIAHLPLLGGEHLSRSLAKEVQQLLRAYPVPIHAIAVGMGPGSYTGIRVGAALGQALAFGWGIPISGYNSLAGYATTPTSAVVLDARGGGLYLFFNGTLQKAPLSEAPKLLGNADTLLSPDAAILQQKLPLHGKQWVQAAPDPITLLITAYEQNHNQLIFNYLDRQCVL